ncbi:SDR family oxidoreductase [Mycolicibacterium neworleansense]|uniref:Short-chain dehydrogenase/reductase SDR n=1 Tax=Mycolicibacterium neworleansense TaxID=146018 RepID=A0A0H5RQN6_9MYCO|nr:SDR family oxidoreductase [Mycolicibacterium neworleansense]MCV7365770.1 SDR family oxidoreductase [Mycolicibacterium neworleansense]CRZ16470.1 short-chain dehydrogenase/reductase SDR [Mycolicibacterium neworleansense]
MPDLTGQVVLVTGAARGTGRVHCERFADAGADVIALNRHEAVDDLCETAEGVRLRGRRCAMGTADISSLAQVTSAVGSGVTALGRLDVATYKRLRPDLDNPTEADAIEVLTARNLLPVPWVEPVDVANAAVFLASGQARYITGTQLVVDAGTTQR